jgi:phosphoribosylanthranilate isomerase
MQPTPKTRVKICYTSSSNEAQLAIQYGASALCLISAMPGGSGNITEDLISQIEAIILPSVSSFLLTSKQNAASIISQQRRCVTNTVQIVDHFPFAKCKTLRDALPCISFVQVIHITGEESVEAAISNSPYVNGTLLDSGNHSLDVKELGGTGRVHDWSISKKICEAIDKPVFLAGGLNSDNIIEL